jgi:hypothetical protein
MIIFFAMVGDFLKKKLWLEVTYPSNYNKSLLIIFLTLVSEVRDNIAMSSPTLPNLRHGCFRYCYKV